MNKNIRPYCFAVCISFFALLVHIQAYAQAVIDSGALRQAVTLDGVRAHQAAFQSHADANGGTRSDGSPGHLASVDYVAGLMSAAGYSVEIEEYVYPEFTELSPGILAELAPDPTDFAYQQPDGFFTFTWSGSGDIGGVPEGVDDGCDASDFVAFTPENIAVIKRGVCGFLVKVLNAEAAGAVAAIVYNDGTTPDRLDAIQSTLGSQGANIPALFTSFAIGSSLAGGGSLVRVKVDASYEQASKNVIAESTSGRADNIVAFGAGLDSIAAGPGINDSGSGAAAILEIAKQLSELGTNPVNKLRFAFWGSSEAGNEGSGHHLLSMDSGELSNVAAYLDFGIVGSPNFARFVYDGDSAASATPGSAEIEQMFLDYFANEAGGLPNEPFSESTGGYHSDLLNFALAGMSVGGLFTGTTGIKSPEQASTYGGTSGNQFDPCNHQPCDTFDNVSLAVLDQMSDAAAHAIFFYAEDGRYIPIPVWSHTGMSLAVLLMALFGLVNLRRRVKV